MMRIITGKAKGFPLKTLPGEDTTRPTSERVKEAIFSAIQFDLEGRRVLDLFAGSGQMGLEALSRGAASCVFVDTSKDACAVVRENARGAKLSDGAQVVNTTAHGFCAKGGAFDLVFLDPPYRAGLIPTVLPLLPSLLRDGATVVCETDVQTALPEAVGGSLMLEKQRRYGKTMVWFYRYAVTGKESAE